MSSPVAERPMVGDVIADKYRIESIAGEGGMGIVYEAEHVILRQRVAIKVLLPGTGTTSEMLDRFSHEARALASIDSEHVVRVVDAGTLPHGAPYLVMEYLEGCDLGALLTRRGKLDPKEVVDCALQALDGLACAHAAGIIHRDLKPSNLFLVDRPRKRRVIKLLDFGVSKSTESEDDRKLTGARIVGSLEYMSPEQLRKSPLDRRTDLWSLGVVMYELLAGTQPFVGEFGDLITGILQTDPPPLRDANHAVSPELAGVVARCLERNVEARWSDAAALAHALAPHGSGAWSSLVRHIDEIVSSPVPSRRGRHFPSYDTALQALDEGVAAPTFSASAARERAHAETEAPPPSRDPLPRATLRILLVDETESVLAARQRLLEAAGFEVRITTPARDFERAIDGWAPHLVLVDARGETGEVLCRRLKARVGASVPLVPVSELPPAALSDGAAFVDYVRHVCAIAYSPEALPPTP